MRSSLFGSAVMALLALNLSGAALADAGPAAAPPDTGAASVSAPSAAGDYLDNWFARVDAAQASQPHWITPLATTTPRLEEEVRYDQFYQHLGNGASLVNFDGGKGLELIPTTTSEII